MLNEQERVADRLVSTIQAIQLERRTGTLTAIRGEGATYESGTIVFVKGKVVQAKAGHHNDRDALNWLSTWGTCRVTFVLSTDSEDIPLQMSPSASLKQVIPLRSKQPDVALYLIKRKGLSRSHRHLFLLIDNVRSTTELASLLNRDEVAVLGLLHDLQEINCIIIPSLDHASR